MVIIYAIKLEKGKYYIGKTNNIKFRLKSHFNSNGSVWTKIYKPLEVIEIIPNCDDYDEDKITLKYMNKYGINNVRGGSFVSFKLDKETINTLTKMNNTANDKCFFCAKKGHFVNNCQKYQEIFTNNSDSDSNDNDSNSDSNDNDSNSDRDDDNKNIGTCFRCGRKGHYAPSCYASTHINGYYIQNNSDSDDNENTDICFRCGRKGHYAPSCYASKHINGYYIK